MSAFGGFTPGEDSWTTHWRYVAIAEGAVVSDLRELHQRQMKGGTPTGLCQCGLPAPCATAETIGAYTATLDAPCRCSREAHGRCPGVVELDERSEA